MSHLDGSLSPCNHGRGRLARQHLDQVCRLRVARAAPAVVGDDASGVARRTASPTSSEDTGPPDNSAR